MIVVVVKEQITGSNGYVDEEHNNHYALQNLLFGDASSLEHGFHEHLEDGWELGIGEKERKTGVSFFFFFAVCLTAPAISLKIISFHNHNLFFNL